MANGIALRADYDARQLRALARGVNDSRQVRRLLSLAAVYDGHNRADAAAIGGMDRQTLRDWVIAFNARGPDRSQHGVVRFRCCDLRAIIIRDFGVELSEVSVGRLLKRLGFSHVSARPRHPEQADDVIDAYKKTSRRLSAMRDQKNHWRPVRRLKSGSRTKRGSGRKMDWSINGHLREVGPASPRISAMKMLIYLVPSAHNATQAQR